MALKPRNPRNAGRKPKFGNYKTERYSLRLPKPYFKELKKLINDLVNSFMEGK